MIFKQRLLPLATFCLTLFGRAPVEAENRAAFNATIDPSVVESLTAETPPAHTAPNDRLANLHWDTAAIEDRGAGKAYDGSLSVNLEPRYSYDTGHGTIMTVLHFDGEATFAGGRQFKIEQDNVGIFFARALYGREAQIIKFLLPAMFSDGKTGQRSWGILSFNCDSGLTTCGAPKLVFSETVERHGRAVIGPAAGLRSHALPIKQNAIVQSSTLVAGCCLNVETGSCRCRPNPPCPLACSHWEPNTCFDCEEVFLCNC